MGAVVHPPLRLAASVKASPADLLCAALLFCASAAAFLWWAVSDQLGGVGGDNAIYELTARHYSPFTTADPIAREFAEQSQYPPLYPLTLALTAPSFRVAHVITVLELSVALALLFGWVRGQGLPRAESALLVLLCAIAPGTFLESLQLHSEMLYLALSLLALVQLSAAAIARDTLNYVLAAIAVTAAALTRTVGVALFVPMAFVLMRSPRSWLPVAIAGSPFLAWHLLHRPAGSYLDVLSSATNSAGALGQRFLAGVPSIFDGWVRDLITTSALTVAAAALFFASLAASAVRLARAKPDGFYVWSYLAIIAIWNFPAEAPRFVWSIAPILLGQLLLEIHALGRRVAGSMPRTAGAAVLAAIALCVVPTTILALQRAKLAEIRGTPEVRYVPEWYSPDPGVADEYSATYAATMRALERVAATVPQGDCVLSVKPAVVSLMTGLRSVEPAAASADERAFDDSLDRSNCRYLLAMLYYSPSFPTPMYPRARLHPDRWQEVFRQPAEFAGTTTDVAILMKRLP